MNGVWYQMDIPQYRVTLKRSDSDIVQLQKYRKEEDFELKGMFDRLLL